MGRQPAREQRLTAQRASAEFREQVTSNAELLRRIGELEEELRQTKNYRQADRNTVTQLKEELDKIKPHSLDGRSTSIPKIKSHTSQAFYNHVDFIYRSLRRFDSSDIAAVTSAAVNKLSRERKEDFAGGLLCAPGLKSAREVLLHDHELKIADHLALEVLTSDHFSLLRLVGGMSKRLCGLIEQAIKWVHHTDGSKTRQVLRPGSTVGMPPIFGLRGINAAEATAESESGVALNDHIDRCGADICGKAHAIDRAMRDSIRWTSRSGGMATKGSLAEPHLMCITGDGAGLTAAKSGVRVGHFPGSTNLLNQSSLDCANWLFYKENSKAEDYTVIAGKKNPQREKIWGWHVTSLERWTLRWLSTTRLRTQLIFRAYDTRRPPAFTSCDPCSLRSPVTCTPTQPHPSWASHNFSTVDPKERSTKASDFSDMAYVHHVTHEHVAQS